MTEDVATGDQTPDALPDVTRWFVIASGHIFSGVTSRGGLPLALCGRWGRTDSTVVDDMPAGKSCETCLRLDVKRRQSPST